jgi:hypothetical protein
LHKKTDKECSVEISTVIGDLIARVYTDVFDEYILAVSMRSGAVTFDGTVREVRVEVCVIYGI